MEERSSQGRCAFLCLATSKFVALQRVRKIIGLVVAVSIVTFYAALLTNFHFRLVTDASNFWRGGEDPRSLGTIYNSMLLHLRAGHFDVDPDAVKWEAFNRDGKTYTYFGILPALLRICALPFVDLSRADLSPLSCLIAVSLAAACKCWTLFKINQICGPTAQWRFLFFSLLAVIVLSGPQISLLWVSVFDEAELWSGALAALFVALAVYALLKDRFNCKMLSLMAIAAGMCLMVRVSTAIGLYCAISLLLLRLFIAGHAELRKINRRLIGPIAILMAFASVQAMVNYERFGSPFMFADLRLYHVFENDPSLAAVIAIHGQLNLVRAPFSLMYYFFPIWTVTSDGRFILSETQHALFSGVELPPSSFLLSDALLLLVAAAAIPKLLGAAADRRSPVDLDAARAITLGLTVTPVLMLSLFWLSPRYRLEFYPLFEFLAFLGFARLVSGEQGGNVLMPWLTARRLVEGAAIVSIVSAHVLLFAYKLSPHGHADAYIDDGFILMYVRNFATLVLRGFAF